LADIDLDTTNNLLTIFIVVLKEQKIIYDHQIVAGLIWFVILAFASGGLANGESVSDVIKSCCEFA